VFTLDAEEEIRLRSTRTKLKDIIMFIRKIIRYLHNWQQSYQGVQQLSQLNDRELVDLGLIRSDISRVVHGEVARHMHDRNGAGPQAGIPEPSSLICNHADIR
jgi:uncharacterized protein YjiS (DUF1127 family)